LRPSDIFIRREVTYTGAWYYGTEDYAEMVDLVRSGLPLDRLVTHDLPAAEAPAAYADFLAGRSGKALLRW
jgi:threonine dehydrogenase-like Zn-dependent dehydrogenase